MPVLDAPVSIPLCCGLPPYSPKNYDLRYHGLLSIRDALQNSFNVPAVKVLYKTGVDASLRTAQAMGITSYNGTPNYTMVKTGTSQNFEDNWTIGYTNDYVMGVWAGNNDNWP